MMMMILLLLSVWPSQPRDYNEMCVKRGRAAATRDIYNVLKKGDKYINPVTLFSSPGCCIPHPPLLGPIRVYVQDDVFQQLVWNANCPTPAFTQRLPMGDIPANDDYRGEEASVCLCAPSIGSPYMDKWGANTHQPQTKSI